MIVFLQGGRSAGPSTEQLASLVGPVPTGEISLGRRMRGGSGTEELQDLPSEHEAFQLGVRFLDLRLALASGNEPEAEEALRRLLVLFARMLLPPPPETRAPYTKMQKELQQRVPPPALLSAASAAEKKTVEELLEDPRLVELGRWTEACRLADKYGRADLFREPATLRVLDEAMRPGGKDADNLDPQALTKVRSIRDTIASGHIDSAILGGLCTKLLDHLASDYQ